MRIWGSSWLYKEETIDKDCLTKSRTVEQKIMQLMRIKVDLS